MHEYHLDHESVAARPIDHVHVRRTSTVSNGKKRPYRVTSKYAPEELQQYDDYDVLTFNFIFPWSLFDERSFESVAPFQVVYTEPIRLAARNIYNQWHSGKVSNDGSRYFHHTDALDQIVRIPNNNFFSIHVRGMKFAESGADTILSNMLQEAQYAIGKDFYDRYGAIAPNSSDSMIATTRNMTTAFITYTVLLVTDVSDLVNVGNDDSSMEGELPNLWRQNWKRIAKKIEANSVSLPLSLLLGEINHEYIHDIDGKAVVDVRANIQLRTAANYKEDVGPLIERLGNNPYAGIYLDQQLAACARLGFTGSHLHKSTFQQLIKSMHDRPLVC